MNGRSGALLPTSTHSELSAAIKPNAALGVAKVGSGEGARVAGEMAMGQPDCRGGPRARRSGLCDVSTGAVIATIGVPLSK